MWCPCFVARNLYQVVLAIYKLGAISFGTVDVDQQKKGAIHSGKLSIVIILKIAVHWVSSK